MEVSLDTNKLLFITTIITVISFNYCIAQVLKKIGLCALSSALGTQAAKLYDTKLTYIGVVHHEFSHALMVILTGAKLKGIQLIKHGDTLGQVRFITRGPKIIQWIQLALIQLGPVIFGQITLQFIQTSVFNITKIQDIQLSSWRFWVCILIMQQIVYHMQLQRVDLKNLSRGIIPLIIVIYFILYFVDINVETLEALILCYMLCIGIHFAICTIPYIVAKAIGLLGGL